MLTRSETFAMTTTADRAFNRPVWEQIALSPRQVQALLSIHCIISHVGSSPVASWYATYHEGAIPTNLEVFRASIKDDKDIYERRVGVTLPLYLNKIIGEHYVTL